MVQRIVMPLLPAYACPARTLMLPLKQPSASAQPGVGESAMGMRVQCAMSALTTWSLHGGYIVHAGVHGMRGWCT